MKRVLVLLLVLVMASSLFITVFAENNTENVRGDGNTRVQGSAEIDIEYVVIVTFDGNGGRNASGEEIWQVEIPYPDPGIVDEPDPDPVHDVPCLDFRGWTLVRNSDDFFDGFGTMHLSDIFDLLAEGVETITFYARWGTHTVAYDATEGQNFDGSQIYYDTDIEHGGYTSIPGNPTRGGYEFRGWSRYEIIFDRYDFNEPVLSCFTLYAHWILPGVDPTDPVDPDPIDPPPGPSPTRPVPGPDDPGDEIDSPEVPLVDPPLDDPPDDPFDIEDPEVPLIDPMGNLPQTGITDWTFLIIILMILGTLLVTTGIVKLARNKKTAV